MTDREKQQTLDWFKAAAFPVLVTVISFFLYVIWQDIKDMSIVVNQMQIQQAVTSSELRSLNRSIESVEKRVYQLEISKRVQQNN